RLQPRRKVLSAVFLVFVMALAALWPGLVFAALDGAAEATPLLGVVAAVFGLVLLIAVWVLAKIPFISGRARAGVAALCAVVVFAGSLAGGVWSPKVRAVQQEVTAPAAVPVVALARARLEPVLGPVLTPVLGPLLGAGAEPAKPAQPAAERQLITLPNSAVSPRSAVEPLLGDIILVGFNFCPRGWRAADGQLFEITSNQSLYSVLGTNYGGDGVTTFAVPDLRGRAPVHRAAGSGPANEQPGRRGGSESTGMRQGNDKISAGRPHLVMNYCIAITGTFPKRN
ncbi:MAG: tail fiber protein, partial [Hyphomicrobiales bacterium]|nr:tail fiber protein [Hyphomicrobiales bacterium]